MIAVEPVLSSRTPAVPIGLDYLLLGDLRQLLEEPRSRENRRWLLAILDRLLVGRCKGVPDVIATRRGLIDEPESRFLPPEIVSQLQRMRDRIAHGPVSDTATREFSTDLERLMDSCHVESVGSP